MNTVRDGSHDNLRKVITMLESLKPCQSRNVITVGKPESAPTSDRDVCF